MVRVIMKRFSIEYLHNWLTAKEHKPLVMRGARQVGKTWLVRELARLANKQLIEINLEKQPHMASLFVSNDPKQILLNLSVTLNQTIDPDQALLFIDEIQAAPDLLGKLRWFAEDLPELPVIAAGSLLDFVLAKHTFSMPVGRISYVHVEPLSFEEFLWANDNGLLAEYLANYHLDISVPIAIHEQLHRLFQEYILIEVNQIHHDLLATYRDDFFKYNARIAVERLDEVMMAIPQMLGQKFVYSRINPSLHTDAVKNMMSLLHKAKICYPVISCAANGVPLGAELNPKFFKEVFLDTGLSCTALGLNLNNINLDTMTLINKGGLAEQVVGQLLRTINQPYMEPVLYYWRRDVKGSSAEIDYVIQHGNQVIPLEVKAGSTGSLKSLHLFMELKKLPLAVRVNADFPSKTSVQMGTDYILLSLPFYLVGQLHRLLTE
jgi:predicted AAA+ superfamily ATPase